MRLILTAGALALALTACGGASHPAPARTASTAAVSPTSAATVSAASRASRPSATDPAPSPQPIAEWCSGTGYHRWQAVTKDLTALQAGSGSGAASAIKLAAEGRQLASNAAAAASYSPPGVSATAYKKGMKDLVTSGRDYEQDELTRATTTTGKASNYLDNISSYVGVKCP